MCDETGCIAKNVRWKGWLPMPEPKTNVGTGPWRELSHRLTDDMARSPAFPPPSFRRILSLPDDSCNLTRMEMVCHYGTHVDAPLHFIADGPAIDEIPLERFHGAGVVWRIEKPDLGVIDVADFEAATPTVQEGDIVVIDTGWSKKLYDHGYHEHPYLSPQAAQWLVDRKVKMLVVDFATPDLPKAHRPPEYAFPVHGILLGCGVLVAEHAAPPPELANRRVEIMFAPINIAGSDGGPVRALVRAAD